MENITVKFNFTSGNSITIEYTMEKFNELKEILEKDWQTCALIEPVYGINFSQVTHYQVQGLLTQ